MAKKSWMERNKKKQERKAQELRDSLKKGDRVQTIGGILGTVVESRDNEVLLKVDETNNTKLRFTRNAIHRVIVEDAAAGTPEGVRHSNNACHQRSVVPSRNAEAPSRR